jgi:hypothetical protein
LIGVAGRSEAAAEAAVMTPSRETQKQMRMRFAIVTTPDVDFS